MKLSALAIALLAGAAALGHPGLAQMPVPSEAQARSGADQVTALFEAANRGEAAPLERAIADPATDATVRNLLRARLAAGRFDAAVARDPELQRLAAAGSDPALRRAALTIITAAAFANGDYAEAARAGRPLAEALAAAGEAQQAAGTERAWRLADMLQAQPRQTVEGAVVAGSAAARTDPVGLPRIDIAINGEGVDAIFDTGANLSVLSATTAARLGVRVIDSTAQIGNSVQSTVGARIGVADRFEIAGTVLRNVTFLVIDDSQLSFDLPTGRYEIHAIVGLPVMRALGRMRMGRERLDVLPSETGAGESNMRASVNTLYVDAEVDGRALPLLLDTGANQTTLSGHFAETFPDAIAGLEVRESNAGGAGGMMRRRVATWPNAPIAIAGRRVSMPTVPVVLPNGSEDIAAFGTLGSNFLRAFESYTLDFNAMRLELGEPVRAAP